MPVVNVVKNELVKSGKCPSSEFVPERERERLRSEAASKVAAALADYCATVPKSAADIITGLTLSRVSPQFLSHPLTPLPYRADFRPLLGLDTNWGGAALVLMFCHRRQCPSLCRPGSEDDCSLHL